MISNKIKLRIVLTIIIFIAITVLSKTNNQAKQISHGVSICKIDTHKHHNLYVVGEAVRAGILKPCESKLHFRINQQTSISSFRGDAILKKPSGKFLSKHSFDLNLDNSFKSYGLNYLDYPLESLDQHACMDVDVDISSLTCKNSSDIKVECPDLHISLKSNFNKIYSSDNSLDICYVDR